MIKQKNNLLWFKLNGLLRYVLMHTATRMLPLYVVNEYPKSGGSWVGEMLSDALGVPFPRNRLPMFRSSILHGHAMHSWNMHNTLIVWRDGRDVLVSQYYHFLFEHDGRHNQRLVEMCRSDLGFADYDDISKNLPKFMEYVYEHKRFPRMSWAEFVNRWAGCARCVHVKYEDLRIRPFEELQRVVEQLSGQVISTSRTVEVVEANSFERLSGRKAGTEDTRSFMRKGIVGDWKTYFSREARDRFYTYAGDALARLNYEVDNTWVLRSSETIAEENIVQD